MKNQPGQVLAQVNLNTLAGTIELLIVIVLLVAGITGLLVLGYALFPGITRQTLRNVEHTPIRSFLVGSVNFIFFGFIAVAFASAGSGGGLIGLILLVILFGFYAIGLGAVALLVGQRLRPGDSQPVRQLLAGSISLELAVLVPLVGWFGVPVVVGLTGLGGLIIALVSRKRPGNPPGPPPPPPDRDFSGAIGGKR